MMHFVKLSKIWTKSQMKDAIIRAFIEELGLAPKKNQIDLTTEYFMFWIDMKNGSHKTYYLEIQYEEWYNAFRLKIYKDVIHNNETKRTQILESSPFLEIPEDKKA